LQQFRDGLALGQHARNLGRVRPRCDEGPAWDQNYISRLLWPDRIGFLPDALVGSYKYGQLRHEPMAPVMVFHGSPKMDELPRSNPLRQIWQDAA
jgi:hypothetical protein